MTPAQRQQLEDFDEMDFGGCPRSGHHLEDYVTDPPAMTPAAITQEVAEPREPNLQRKR